MNRATLLLLVCFAIHATEDTKAATAFADEAAKLARGLVDPLQKISALRSILHIRAALPMPAQADSALAEFATAVAAAEANMPDKLTFLVCEVAEETQRIKGTAEALSIATALSPGFDRDYTIADIFVRDMESGKSAISCVRGAQAAIGKPEHMSKVFVRAIEITVKQNDVAAMEELVGISMNYAAVADDTVESLVEIAIALAKAGQTEAAATVVGRAALVAQRYRPEFRDHAIGVVAIGWGGIGDMKHAIVLAKTQSNQFMPNYTIASAFSELLRVQGPESAIAAIGLLPLTIDKSEQIGNIAWDAAMRKQIPLAETLTAQIDQPFARSSAQSGLLVAYGETGAMDKATAAAIAATTSALLVTDHRKCAILLEGIVSHCIRLGVPVPERTKIIAEMVAYPDRFEAKERTYAASEAAQTLLLLGADPEARATAARCGDRESEPYYFVVVDLHKAGKTLPASLMLALRDAATRSAPASASKALNTIVWVQSDMNDTDAALATAATITEPDMRRNAIVHIAKAMASHGNVAGVRTLLVDGSGESAGIRIAGLVAAAEELMAKPAVTGK